MSQPGQPNNPDMFPPAPAATSGGPTGETPAKGNKSRQRKVLVIFLIVVVAIFVAIYFATRSNADNAKVGDCVAQDGENSVKVVKCDDPSAAFKVVGRVENQTEDDAVESACDPYADKGAEQAFWEGEDGKPGLVLCLATNK